MAKKDDFTGLLENVISEEVALFQQTLQGELARVRPVGSARVSEDEQRVEWELMQENPIVLAKFFIDQNASVASAIRYAAKMAHSRKRG